MNNVRCGQIAQAINLIANLPSDDSYVHVIGTGEEKNNFEALQKWVMNQEDLLELDPAGYRLERLINRLHSQINEFRDQFCH